MDQYRQLLQRLTVEVVREGLCLLT